MEYELAVNNTRVYNIANASIQDNFTAERVVRNLKMRNAWASLSELWLPCSGLEMSGNPLIASNIYGVKGVHDLTQSTGAAQPTYSANSLTFDGSDDTLSKTITKAQILALTSSGDFTFQWTGKLPQLANGVSNTLLSIYVNSTNSILIRALGYTGNKLRLNIGIGANATGVSSSTANGTAVGYSATDLLQLTFTYIASTGVFNGYVNSVDLGTGSSTLGDINNISSTNYPMNFANSTTTFSANTMYGCAFFKGILTPARCKLEVV